MRRIPAPLAWLLHLVSYRLLHRRPRRVVASVPAVTRRHRPDEVPPSAVLAASIDQRDPDGPVRSIEDGPTRPIVVGDVPRPLLFPDKYLSGRNRRPF